MESYKPPGRIGDPSLSLGTDPRTNPKLLPVLRRYGMDKLGPASPLKPDAPLDQIRASFAEADKGHRAWYLSLNSENPVPFPFTNIETTDVVIPGPEGNAQLRLTIRRPLDAAAAGGTSSTSSSSSSSKPPLLPAVVYTHGGGMVIGATDTPPQNTLWDALAGTGLIVISTHFRNAYTPEGDNPFPAGLDDCVAATRWAHAHRAELGADRLVVAGESGGGNLSLAVALRARHEGWVGDVDGVVGLIPFISGAWGASREWKLRELPSLVENDGYAGLDMTAVALFARMYDPAGENQRNPLAWPYWAGGEDLTGLPPHLIVTSELDPFRDEGNAYARKLAGAGVRTVAKTTLGVHHGGEILFREAVPEMFESSVWEVKKFIDTL